MSIDKKYLNFLIESEFWPKHINYDICQNEENDSFITRGNKYLYNILDIKLTIHKTFTKMITFKLTYLDCCHFFNVYGPVNISPNEFYNRCNRKISYIIYSLKEDSKEFKSIEKHCNDNINKYEVKLPLT